MSTRYGYSSESYAQAVKSTVITAPFYGKCPMEIAQEQDDTSGQNNSLEPTVKATLVFLFLGCISLSIYEGATRLRPADRYLALIVLPMFLIGAAMAWAELRQWWNTRIEQFGEPPLANLLKFVPTSDQLRGRFRPSAQKLNQSTEAIENGEPTKAA
jgi:hypothetical protein